ncbi:MAG: DUF1127 domain-containing protein [Rhodovibrionaceae bacterium]
MHSNTQALAIHSFAMNKANAAIDAAGRVAAALDFAAAQAGEMFRRYAESRRRHRAMVETITLLSRLDDHQLRDIGVERGQIAAVSRGVCD